MTNAALDRISRLMPNGIPRWIRVYDNGGRTIDRYSCIFTGRYTHKTGGMHWVADMSEDPYWPQGVGLHSEYRGAPDTYWRNRPSKWGWAPKVGDSHPDCGCRIEFSDLPEPCKKMVMRTYVCLWDIPEEFLPDYCS